MAVTLEKGGKSCVFPENQAGYMKANGWTVVNDKSAASGSKKKPVATAKESAGEKSK